MKMNRYTLCMAAAALFAALALTGCSLLKVAVATGDPLSKEEMNIRTMTRGFYYDMASEVSRTADSIAAAAPDIATRVAAVRWKIRATRAGVSAAMQGIPDVALADMWILCRRMDEGFAAAPDSLLFGAQSDLARDAAARLDRRAARLARQVLAVDRYGLMERFVGDYVRENPADGEMEGSNTTLAWIEFLRANGIEHAYATGSIAEVLADVNDRVSGQTQQLANSVGWSKDLIAMQLQQDSMRLEVGARLDSLERNFTRIVVVAEHLPEISDKVLEELNKQVTQLIYTMNYSLDNAFANFDRQRDELQRYVTAERQAGRPAARVGRRRGAEGTRRRAGTGRQSAAVCGAGARGAHRRAVRPGILAGRRARAGSQEEGKGRVTACFPLWIYLCGKGISAQTGGASAYCKQSLHLRSACTIFAAKSGLWPEKKQITP